MLLEVCARNLFFLFTLTFYLLQAISLHHGVGTVSCKVSFVERWVKKERKRTYVTCSTCHICQEMIVHYYFSWLEPISIYHADFKRFQAGVSPLLQHQFQELARKKPGNANILDPNKRRKLVVIGQDCVEPLQALRSASNEVKAAIS